MARTAPPAWFRVVAIVLVLWGLAGVYACVQQFRFGAEAMGPPTDYDRRLYESLPVWYNFVYLVAVAGGLLGALALVFRSVLARPLFTVSLAAVLIQFGFLFATTDIVAAKGVGTVMPFPIFIVAVALFQVWLAHRARQRGWIG